MMDAGRHPNIDVLTNTEVVELKGSPGRFKARVRQKSRFVDADKCVGCGDCVDACPKHAPNAFDLGLAARKAIYRPFPQSVPSTYLIDEEICINLTKGLRLCSRCARACKREAVDFDQPDREIDLQVGAVIVAAGFDEYRPQELLHYGYGVSPDVLTALEFERLLNASGPTKGHVVRPSDRRPPKRIAFVQCVGSRGEGERDSCSRFCCTNSLKDILLARQHLPELEESAIFFTDLRTAPKGCEIFAERVKAEPGVRLIRGRPAKIKPEGDRYLIYTEDTFSGERIKYEADLVVLASAAVPPAGLNDLATTLGVDVAPDGFLALGNLPASTTRQGVYLCGGVTGARTIPESVARASAAAGMAAGHMAEEKLPEENEAHKLAELDCSGPPRIGVFICHCGVNISGVVEMTTVVEAARQLPGVVYAGDELFACAEGSQETIQKVIVEERLNRVVLAACTPRTHEPVFRAALAGVGLNPYLLEMANIRDQCSWVHATEPELATSRARQQIQMAIQRVAMHEPLYEESVPVISQGLIVGGGVAGMACAASLARQGIPTTLVEEQSKLGGRLADPGLDIIDPNGEKATKLLARLRQAVKKEGVEVLSSAEVQGVSGAVGNFEINLIRGRDNGCTPQVMKTGAIALATGADIYEPTGRFGYGTVNGVLTSQDLAARIKRGKPPTPKAAVFIQCVGSRGDGDNKWCSSICCASSVRHAIALRRQGSQVVVLHRGIRAADRGLEEEYRLAREAGVLFARYQPGKLPTVIGEKNVTAVRVMDPLLRREIEFPAELVVLATGMIPREPITSNLQEMFKTPRSPEGFLAERHPELAPVETVVDGVFLCGTLGGPMDVETAVGQGLAVAAKMASLLGRTRLPLDPTVAAVDPKMCRACGQCVEICEYNAPLIETDDRGRKVARILPELCKGCGTCPAWCPTGAIKARHFTDQQVFAMVQAALADPGGEE